MTSTEYLVQEVYKVALDLNFYENKRLILLSGIYYIYIVY